MKVKTRLLYLFAAFIICSSLGLPPTTHVITLQVDTGNISNSNVDEVSNFGQSPSISNHDFLTEVSLGDIVMWNGVSSSAPDQDKVIITSINHEGGARIFGRNTLKDSKQNPGVVVGIVSEGKEGDEEKYKVSFKVLNRGNQRNGTFHIDPKLQVKK